MPALSVQGHSDPQQQVHLEEDPAEIHHTCGSSCLLTPYEPQSGPSALADGQGLGGLCKMPCRSSGRESMMVSIWDCSLGRVPGLTGSWSFSAWVWETTRRWITINVVVKPLHHYGFLCRFYMTIYNFYAVSQSCIKISVWMHSWWDVHIRYTTVVVIHTEWLKYQFLLEFEHQIDRLHLRVFLYPQL